ncbi:iron ABC transporter permease [Chelatococcus sp. SYSU_G07232]|uniref:Iron ABC transporter permease n=1 Tax=Chelatococcus albus TaxID=3047466 RepID=A0ABT7AJ15_9HYPH|nr:iron ABC transporter permease [Chelatococcus sp. SYSU_G07232]MDJ1158799.1 iron ABC transporter permease [Chelatococcus sp. SYSU_G07232]
MRKTTGEAAGRGGWLVPALVLLVLILVVLSLALGPVRLSLGEAAAALVADRGGASLIVREIRLPRALLAVMIGAVFGLAGGALQGLLRNPLAEPSVFGASQSAALGAVVVLYFGIAEVYSALLPVAAIAGAFLSVALVVLAAGPRAGTVLLVLAGLVISSLAGAATALAISLSPNPFAVTEIVFWLMGSLEDRTMRHVALAAPFAAVAVTMLLACGGGLRALALGEDAAASLGVDLRRLRLLVVAGSAVGVGASVAVAGSIGFVGLVAPHLVRPLVGHDPKRALLPSALAGAALLTAADCVVRLVPSTTEVKLGVLTALVGVPFFLWIILRRRAELAEMPA